MRHIVSQVALHSAHVNVSVLVVVAAWKDVQMDVWKRVKEAAKRLVWEAVKNPAVLVVLVLVMECVIQLVQDVRL